MEGVTDEELEGLTLEQTLTGESQQAYAQRIFQDNAVAAAYAITKLAKYGAAERIRLQAAQYVVERVLGRVQDNPPKPEADPYETLLMQCVEAVTPDSTNTQSNKEEDGPK